MPNWAWNTLEVFGTDESVRGFMADMATPVTQRVNNELTEVETKFSLRNLVSPAAEDLEQYFTSTTDGDPKGWYDWNNENWGTKWDAQRVSTSEVTIAPNGKTTVTYTFETAWAEPVEAYKVLAAKYPHLRFDMTAEYSLGALSRYITNDGELILTEEHGEAESHQDYVDRGLATNCLCQSGYDEDEWFDDCPQEDEDE